MRPSLSLRGHLWLLLPAALLLGGCIGVTLLGDRAVPALGPLALLSGAAVVVLLWRLDGASAAAMGQAQALLEGRLVSLPDGGTLPSAVVTEAMNALVQRLKVSLEAQAAQVELLRQQAHCDPLTGLSSRGHFLDQFEAALGREDGDERFGLVLLRLCDLTGVNREHGHPAADRLLGAIAEALRPYGERVPGCLIGRLSGSDFALCLPARDVALETAQALASALRAVLTGPGQVDVVLGVVELHRETALEHAMALAEDALSRAEAVGDYAVEFSDESARVPAVDHAPARLGVGEALAHERARLMAFPLVDAAGELVHIESPLRLQLQAGGEFDVAARWLPLAVRGHVVSAVDLRAVTLALAAIGGDGRPRCVTLAPASLAEAAFVSRLRALLLAAPHAAGKLSLELAETAAVERTSLVRELVRQLSPCGVRVGLQHAGARLGRIDRLFSLGLDFVKLDAATARGVGNDARRRSFVHGSIELLHGLSMRVYAEGVNDDDDAQALWACGVDGIAGPWASQRHAMAA